MPEEIKVPAAVVQIRFKDVDQVVKVAEALEYWLGIPLPNAVVENPTHSEKFLILADLKNVFAQCVKSYQAKLGQNDNVGLDAGPQFGSNGAITGS